jgi:hypothetical protein
VEKGAAFITALVTLISGTMASTLGLGVITGIVSDFGSQTNPGPQVQLSNFAEDVNRVCRSIEGRDSQAITGAVTGFLSLQQGRELRVDVDSNTALIPMGGEQEDLTQQLECNVLNDEKVVYSHQSSYLIYPRPNEGGVSLG